MRECSGGNASLRHVRVALERLGSHADSQPALGPLLLGSAALLTEQSRHADDLHRLWIVERSAFLNSGDDTMLRILRLMMYDLGLYHSADYIDLESGVQIGEKHSDGILAFGVSEQLWTRSELLAIASLLRRLAARQPIGRQAVGCVQPRRESSSWRPRKLESWPARILTAVTAWRVQMLGV